MLKILLTGIIMGNTVCVLSSCAISPIMYLSATDPGIKHTVRLITLLSLSRIITYAILGAIAGKLGLILNNLIGSSIFGLVVGLITGAINIIIGVFIIFGQKPLHCSRICRYADGMLKQNYSMVLLGIFLAIIPCAPLTSLFTQVMIQRGGLLIGAAEGALFGVGITLSLPFWGLALFSGTIPGKILKNERVARVFKIICGSILFIIGLKYIIAA